MIEAAPGPQPSMPTHSAADASAPLPVTVGTLNVPPTEVNGPPATPYPDQLLLFSVGAAGAAGTRESATAIASATVPECPAASAARTVKANCPSPVGVPDNVPPPDSVMPGGSVPEASDQL